MAYDQFGNYVPDGQGTGSAGGYDQFGNPQQPNGSGQGGPIEGGSPYGGDPNAQYMGYGYGMSPNSSNTGYYQQNTPMGGFAAADYSQGGPQQYAGQQQSQAYGYSNPYIGQNAAQISGPNSVMGYAQGGQYSNPYLGQQSQQSQQQGSNPYAGSNPYLQNAIDSTSQDATRNFTNSVMPGLDRMMQTSGSFGNSGVQQMQNQAYSDLGRNLGNISSGMRMQDYGMQQGLAENQLNRNQANSQFNSGLSAADLARNMSGGFQQAGMNNGMLMQAGMFDAGQQMGTQQFNANAYNGMQQNNAGLAQGQGQFNAGGQNQNSMFNAGQGNGLNQFNAGQGNQMNMFGQGQRNGMNMYNAGAGNTMLGQTRNLQQNQGQFDASLDRGIYNDNMGWMRQGQQDQLGLYDRMFGWNQGGQNSANQIQNTPLNYWQQFMNGSNQAGQNGGTNTNGSTMQGNPYLGFMGGAQFGNGLYNYWNQGGG